MFYHEEKSQLIAVKQGIRWSLQLDHYVGTLKKKPGALATSSALQQASPKLKANLPLLLYHSPERIYRITSLYAVWCHSKEIESSINQLRNIHPSHVTTEKIKLCAKQKEEQTPVLTYSSQKQLILNTIQKHKRTIRMFQTKYIH